MLQPVGSVTHTLNFDAGQGGGLQVAALVLDGVGGGQRRHPQRRHRAHRLRLPSSQAMAQPPCSHSQASHIASGTQRLLSDSFNQPAFNTQLWNLTDPGSHLSLGGAGLISGGNGLTVRPRSSPSTRSRWRLPGRRGGQPPTHLAVGRCPLRPLLRHNQRANCFAGYNVRQSSGSTVVTPYVNRAEVGTTYTLLSGIMGEMSEYLASHGVPVVRAHLPFRPDSRPPSG